MTKVKVDFYANNFKHCILDVPEYIKPRTQEARNYITGVISSTLLSMDIRPKDGGEWETEKGYVDNNCWHVFGPHANAIQIITAKIIK
jgi:hypothetical protein